MHFFDRTQEIARLHKIEEQSYENAQFTVLSGRRRIGKTMLVREAYKDKSLLYFGNHAEFFSFLFCEYYKVNKNFANY